MLVSSTADYQDMFKLLSRNGRLAKVKVRKANIASPALFLFWFAKCKVVHDPSLCMCVCVCVCESLASHSSETIEVVIIKFGTVTTSKMLMRRVFIILTSTFIQGHTDLNHENNNCLNISETIQAMPINFAVKIVRLKVYMTIASPITVSFIQGHKCVSNLTTF